MTVSRRDFLGGLVSAALFNRLYGAAEGEPQLKFGYLSDPHLCRMTPANEVAFAHALKGFAAANVDAVVVSGDLLDMGTVEEMERLLAVWRAAFPNGQANDGRPVTPFVVWGNHDYMCASYMRRMTPAQIDGAFPHRMMDEKDRWWRELTGDPFPGEVFHKKIRGFSFVGAHWGHEEETGDWMKAHAADIDTSRLFFHVQHPHPADTVYGDKGGPQLVRKFLSQHPNCLSLSGHSHLSMDHGKALWQGSFAAMTGSVPANHAAILSVHPDRLVIARRDVKHARDLPEWVLPLPLAPHADQPFPFLTQKNI